MFTANLKTAAAFAMAVLTAIIAAVTDNRITPVEGVVIAIAVVNAFNTLIVPNLSGGAQWAAKAIVVVSGAVLALAANLILGGFTASEILQLAAVALQAFVVFMTPSQLGRAAARAR
jgi:hypothetical protein